MALQFRRGTDAERQQFEFAEGEPVYVTDTGELYIGDGETQGGRRVLSGLSEESDPELGGNLDLNDNNIVGIGNINIDGNLSVSGLGQSLDLNDYNIIGRGNINIDGTITATGDINLGDGAEDNVIVGGQISSPLTPAEDGLYDLGSDSLRWRNGFFEGVEVDGKITAGSIAVDTIFTTGSIYSQDSSTIYDADLDTITVSSINSDLVGSVFGDDSTTLLDATTNTVNLDGMSLNFNVIELDNADQSLIVRSANEERSLLKIFTDAADWSLRIDGLSDGSNCIGNLLNVYRGSLSSPEAVQPGDFLFKDAIISWSGFDTIPSTAIVHAVDENATIQSGSVPGKLHLVTFTEDDVTTAKGIVIDKDGRVAISHSAIGYTARETLDVNGGGIFEGSVEAASFIGSLMSDDSNTLIDAITGEVLAPIRDITVAGKTGTPTSNTDNLSPVEWLEITVNNNTRYIPLYE